MNKYFLSDYSLINTPILPSFDTLMESVKETNENAKVYYDHQYGCTICECENQPKNKLFSGIDWYPFLAGIQPRGYYGG